MDSRCDGQGERMKPDLMQRICRCSEYRELNRIIICVCVYAPVPV